MTNLISVSSAPMARFGNKKYYDLVGTIEVMKRVLNESVVDGFELQLEPEWDSENPPLSDGQFADWTKTPKYTTADISELVKAENLPILSVHGNRDIGGYLCSGRAKDLEKGKRLIFDTLSLAQDLGSEVCVFHLWGTWKTRLDLKHLKKAFSSVTAAFPNIKASVENIPTHSKGQTPLALVKSFDYVTLDLRWASMYNELYAFESIRDTIVNVHLRGRLDANRWSLDQSSYGFYEAFNKIKNEWGYSGLFTVEPDGPREESLFQSFLEAMRSLKKA